MTEKYWKVTSKQWPGPRPWEIIKPTFHLDAKFIIGTPEMIKKEEKEEKNHKY